MCMCMCGCRCGRVCIPVCARKTTNIMPYLTSYCKLMPGLFAMNLTASAMRAQGVGVSTGLSSSGSSRAAAASGKVRDNKKTSHTPAPTPAPAPTPTPTPALNALLDTINNGGCDFGVVCVFVCPGKFFCVCAACACIMCVCCCFTFTSRLLYICIASCIPCLLHADLALTLHCLCLPPISVYMKYTSGLVCTHVHTYIRMYCRHTYVLFILQMHAKLGFVK